MSHFDKSRSTANDEKDYGYHGIKRLRLMLWGTSNFGIIELGEGGPLLLLTKFGGFELSVMFPWQAWMITRFPDWIELKAREGG